MLEIALYNIIVLINMFNHLCHYQYLYSSITRVHLLCGITDFVAALVGAAFDPDCLQLLLVPVVLLAAVFAVLVRQMLLVVVILLD